MGDNNLTQLQIMAARLNLDETELWHILMNTIMPSTDKMIVTNEMLVTFLAIANEYGLNPLTKEIYAFPAKGGGLQTTISIDGWLRIMNTHPQFDGVEISFSDTLITHGNKNVPEFCRVRMYRKDTRHPVEIIEYFLECVRDMDTWANKPRRLLQHKATIQAVRYAFGINRLNAETDTNQLEQRREIDVTEQSQALEAEPPELRIVEKDDRETLIGQWVETKAVEFLNAPASEKEAIRDRVQSKLSQRPEWLVSFNTLVDPKGRRYE